MTMFLRGEMDVDQVWEAGEGLQGDDDVRRDESASPQSAVGTVKWFDRVKGYGFIVPEQGGADIMVHEKCLASIGRAALQGGERVNVTYDRGRYGFYAVSVCELSPPSAEPVDEPRRPTDFAEMDPGDGSLLPARVKWFDRERGFGFVTVFGDTEDVFLHMQTVRRCGLSEIADGEAVAVRTAAGPRGTMVSDLRLWEAGGAN